MKTINQTHPAQCHFCKEYGEVKFIKVSPKRSKPACLRCYEMMTVKPDIKLDNNNDVWISEIFGHRRFKRS